MLDFREKARFVWRCHRGMLELDLILKSFLENQFNSLSLSEIDAFESLLNCTDPELYAWLMGHEEPTKNELKEIVAIIRNSY